MNGNAAGAEDPADLPQHRVEIDRVIQHVRGVQDIEAGVCERDVAAVISSDSKALAAIALGVRIGTCRNINRMHVAAPGGKDRCLKTAAAAKA